MSREEITAFLSRTRLLAVKQAVMILESLEKVPLENRDGLWKAEVARCKRVIESEGKLQ